MCLQRLKELILDPVVAITKAKREKNLNKTLQILIVEWILIAIAILIYSSFSLTLFISVSLALLGITATLFFGFLLQTVFHVLGGKGKYFEGLTSVTYAIFPIAIGVILSIILLQLQLLGSFLTFIAATFFIILGMATLYRSIREFFIVDIVTAWIGISILTLGTFLAIYLTVGPLLFGKLDLTTFMAMRKMI